MSTTTTTREEAPLDISTLSEEERKDLIIADTVSIASDTNLAVSTPPFTLTKTLLINARGIGIVRPFISTSERSISVTKPDGTLLYTSTRAQSCSGTCTLTDAEENRLIGTEYFFGPGRDPVLQRLDREGCEIKTLSKWTSRNHIFMLPDGRTCEWRYKREKGFGSGGATGTALLLSVQGVRAAQLIRNDETRTLGSKSCSAGNGGELQLGEDVGGKMGVEEDVVVATCLLMLKKEMDRRRCVQLIVPAAIIL
ncbi:hypothetical protein C7974DRAFT_14026 [Boeremia exigua]|uniref:uncharacterized protein n=1 Tax=Boeremia exigua TaxID=749465 RepID=UPI001E8D59A0|nr:uncharacterized protein C7974DRAFT_14026 [Boeremia exigua]KAH6644074.1 hypothetical protein C7974DRAFT_14026 [Boeremia exigua]